MQFDTFAHCYEQNARVQAELIEWGLPLLPKISREDSVLELGAGTGLFTKHLVESNPGEIVASDISTEMIRYGQIQFPKTNWLRLNAWSPPKHLKPTLIASSSLLQWSPSPPETLAHWHTLLPKGGKVVALFFIDKTLQEARALQHNFSPIDWRTREQWVKYFERAGFVDVFSESREVLHWYNNPIKFLKSLKLMGTTERNALNVGRLKHFIKRYEQDCSSENSVYATWHYCAISATAG